MTPTPPWQRKAQFSPYTQPVQEHQSPTHRVERTLEVKTDALKHPTGNLIKSPFLGGKKVTHNVQQERESDFRNFLNRDIAITDQPTQEHQSISRDLVEDASLADISTLYLPTMRQAQRRPETAPNRFSHDTLYKSQLEGFDTIRQPSIRWQAEPSTQMIPGYQVQQKSIFTRGKALLLVALLCMILLQAFQQGSQQIFGAQGWAYVLGGPSGQKTNLLDNISNQTHGKLTPQQYIDTIIQSMTLEQKLGQMMLVQFVGPNFSLDLNTMISQYNVGSVLLLTGNQNIISKPQLTSLTQQIQRSSALPMMISLDQEGGLVDRLAKLDGPRPSVAAIAATGNPARATKAGEQDAQDLSTYGINLQLGPVVDVGTPYSVLQQQGRTFGQNANIVTTMAGAYLQGLQQSNKVLGTLKHFPGLGSSTVDPHQGLPRLNHTHQQLDQIDWAPYRNLINQGLVHAIMVTHEVVTAIDSATPASLSSKIVTGVLRNQMGFQGVIMTDSLTMEGISAFYSTKQAAVLAVAAGSDIIMGADTPGTVATMVQGIKEAISTGQISEQRINQSVSRILMLKYQMGLLTLPNR